MDKIIIADFSLLKEEDFPFYDFSVSKGTYDIIMAGVNFLKHIVTGVHGITLNYDQMSK